MISINSHPSAMNGSFKPSTFSCSSNGLECKPSKASIFANPNISSPTHPWSSSQLKFPNRRTKVRLSASAMVTGAEQSLISLESTSESPSPKKKLRVLAKPMERPRIMLKFIWMQSNIGIALDQAIPGYGTIPLSPYYFWPRKDAWEELKVLLEGKSWISQKQMVVLLNQATDIINLWQQSGVNLS